MRQSTHAMTHPATSECRPRPATRAQLRGLGSALPGRDVSGASLDNANLAALVDRAARLRAAEGGGDAVPCDPSFAWQRAGIAARGVLEADADVHDLALAAARNALRDAGPGLFHRIGLLVVGTVTAEPVMPAVATRLHEALGLPPSCHAFDLSLGCNGFVAALDVARRFLATSESGRCALVVGADAMTRVLDAADRTTSILFGDGAGAWLLEQGEGAGLGPTEVRTLGAGGDNIVIRAAPPDTRVRRIQFRSGEFQLGENAHRLRVEMRGRQVFRDMVRVLPRAIEQHLDQMRLSVHDVDLFLFHQANRRLVEGVVSATPQLDARRVLFNIDTVGNTTNASIPLLLDRAREEGLARPGQRLALVGFGTGYSLGVSVIHF